MPVLIEVKDLSYVHPHAGQASLPALQNITFSIEEGELVALVGANGSGKTTLARHLNSLLVPAAGMGSVLITGYDTRQKSDYSTIRTAVGMVFQSPEDQIVGMTVEEDVAFGPENLGIAPAEIRRRVSAALETVDMEQARMRPPHQLSAGQMQRVALAGILAMRPRCIIFDEATSMLDPQGRRDVMDLLLQLNHEGLTIIYITHFMEEAARARRVIALSQGRIVLDGTPAEVFSGQARLEEIGLSVPPAAALADLLRPALPTLPRALLTGDDLLSALPAYPNPRSSYANGEAQTTTEGPLLIEVSNLGYTYLRGTPFAQRALAGVSLKAGDHVNHGLIGSTGSGKSTLLQHLNGLIRPQEGTVRVGPFDLNDARISLKSVCQYAGLAFQNPEAQFFEQYVGDEIAFGPRQMGMKTGLARPVRQAMELVGLDFEKFKDRLTFTLSGGEKRKVALASVLALNPTLLLLDEPLAGMDPLSHRELLAGLKGLSARGMTLVISSHYMEDLVDLTENLTLLKSGQDVLSGSNSSVFSNQEMLRQAGLEPPLVTRVGQRLRHLGWPVPDGVLHAQDLVNRLEQTLQGGMA
jgi:energy-coupling factor transport system ATP-binding protein